MGFIKDRVMGAMHEEHWRGVLSEMAITSTGVLGQTWGASHEDVQSNLTSRGFEEVRNLPCRQTFYKSLEPWEDAFTVSLDFHTGSLVGASIANSAISWSGAFRIFRMVLGTTSLDEDVYYLGSTAVWRNRGATQVQYRERRERGLLLAIDSESFAISVKSSHLVDSWLS